MQTTAPNHSRPCEEGGAYMSELQQEMISDAVAQIQMLDVLMKRLDEAVEINDQCKVRSHHVLNLCCTSGLQPLRYRKRHFIASRVPES